MSGGEVLATCWGQPDKINDTMTANGTRSQWVYRNAYVYLTGGVVTAIQTSH
jgi:hypothetical protein